MHPTIKKGFSGGGGGKYKKYILLYVKFTTVLARPFVLRAKWCPWDFRRVKKLYRQFKTHPTSQLENYEAKHVLIQNNTEFWVWDKQRTCEMAFAYTE
jgi:hypothetical protein